MDPSNSPTIYPTKSLVLSTPPSSAPSFVPTATPTRAPTAQPTWTDPSAKETKFRQEFLVGNGREFNADEIILFQTIYRSYKVEFAPIPEEEVQIKIITTCILDRQEIIRFGDERRQLHSYSNKLNESVLLLERESGNNSTPQLLRRRREQRQRRVLQDEQTVTLVVDYTMKYVSMYYNVTQYPKLFQNWTNSNLDKVLEQMQTLRMNVTEVDKAQRIVVSTPAPSASFAPSIMPPLFPPETPAPSQVPSDGPSVIPRSAVPSLPVAEVKWAGSITIITVSIVINIITVSIIACGVFIYYKKRRDTRGMEAQANGAGGRGAELQ